MKTKEELQDELHEQLSFLISFGKDIITNENTLEYGQWCAQATNLLGNLIGKEHTYFKNFNDIIDDINRNREGLPFNYNDGGRMVSKALGVLIGFKSDFEIGLLEDQREVLRGEIYSDLTELGEILLEDSAKGYEPAAVIFGVVLEDKLRKLCDKHDITIGASETLAPINQKLCKAGVYDKTEMKRIGLLSAIRNDAAHACWENLDKPKIQDFHRQVVDFLARYSR